MTCKDCQYLDVLPDRGGKRRTYANRMYRCLAPLPPRPVLPDCIKAQAWEKEGAAAARGQSLVGSYDQCRAYMSPSDGDGCPVYLKIVKAKP